jgi:hypothetical protein
MGCFLLLVPTLFLSLLISFTQANPQCHQRADFKICLTKCLESEDCENRYFPRGQSLINRLFLWDCHSECQYQCMWLVEEEQRKLNAPACQYHGKWPFPRVLGIQELGSALFSVGNLAAHWHGYNKIYLSTLGGNVPSWLFLHRFIYFNYIVALNGWVWSTIFHSRETWLTIYLDYFSAIAIVMSMMTLALVRCLTLTSIYKQAFLIISVAIFFFFHIDYMLNVDFDYSWNMKVAIAAGVVFSGSFLIWSIRNILPGGRRPHAKFALAATLLGLSAAVFEVFDFPPKLYFFDAHACWHAATIPIVSLWYHFYAEDAAFDIGPTDGPKKELDHIK